MPKGVFLVPPPNFHLAFGPELAAQAAALIDIPPEPVAPADVDRHAALLREADCVLSSWGMPRLDGELLAKMPRLKAVFYGAGSVRGFTTDAAWNRGIRIVSAWGANAVPVAEFAFAQIVLALKRAWPHAMALRGARAWSRLPVAGAFASTVGLVSLGMIGRLLCERLRTLDVRILAHDPFVSPEAARALGAELRPLGALFAESDVVSLHTPWLPETERLIRGAHFDSMKPGAAFINTARGAVVHEQEMIAALQRRPDLFAALDVTWPEPPPPDSPLFTLPNVMLTPHIAGSIDGECRRMGRFMIDELRRWLAGEPFLWEVTREKAGLLA